MTDISMVRGETLDIAFAVVDAQGIPVPLAGFTVICVISWQTSGELQFSTTAGTISVANNVASLRLLPASTLSLPNRTLYHSYEVKARSPLGIVRQIARGKLTVQSTYIENI